MKKKIESLKGRKSPCWVKVKFNELDECVYGIAYYAETQKEWFILQNKMDGCEPRDLINSGLKYSWTVQNGTERAIKVHDISELYILPKKPKTKEFENITLKFKKAVVINLNDDYNAIICKGHIRVGCQDIPNKVIKKVYKHLID